MRLLVIIVLVQTVNIINIIVITTLLVVPTNNQDRIQMVFISLQYSTAIIDSMTPKNNNNTSNTSSSSNSTISRKCRSMLITKKSHLIDPNY